MVVVNDAVHAEFSDIVNTIGNTDILMQKLILLRNDVYSDFAVDAVAIAAVAPWGHQALASRALQARQSELTQKADDPQT